MMARAALAGGAAGLRVNGAEDIRAVRPLSTVPLVGLNKVWGRHRLLITPTLDLARAVVLAGADVVAVDATDESAEEGRPPIEDFVGLGVPVMADVSTLQEATRAFEAGATVVSTTLSGYTAGFPARSELPDVALVAAIAREGIPVVAEGRYRTPDQVANALDCGAIAVVVGGAITDPYATTRLFAAATPQGSTP